MESLGVHILAEYYDCDCEVLDNSNEIERHLNNAAQAAGATIVQSAFHQFNPMGVSGVVVIAESHLTIHTWPEHGYAAVDIFTCGDTVDPWRAFEHLKQELKSTHFSTMEMKRGQIDLIKYEQTANLKVVAGAR